MNFLHKFLPQPCFDNAGANGGGGGGGSGGSRSGPTRDRSPSMDSVGNFSGGFGQNAVSGAARSGAGSRDGYGYGAAGAVGRGQPARGSGLAARSTTPPRATVTVAPTPTPSYAPPVQQLPAPTPTPAVAAPPAVATPAAPVSMAPNAYGPAAIGSAPMSESQVASLAASNVASAPVAAAPTRSMSPATRSTPAQAAAARAVGAQAAAQRAGQAVSATPSGGGRAGGVGTPGVGGGFGPAVSNAGAKSDRGLPSVGGNLDGPGAIGIGAARGIGNQNTPSNVAGKSDRGVPGLNSRSNMAGLLGEQRFGGSSTVSQNNPAPARAAKTTPGAQFGNIGLGIGLESIGQDPVLAGRAAALAASSPQALARGYASIGRGVPQGLPQVNQNSRAVQNAVRGIDLSRPNYSGNTPNDGGPAFGSLVGGGLSPATPSGTPPANSRRTQEDFKELLKGDGYFDSGDYGFYSSDNSYEGVNFPSVNDAYPTSAAPMTGGYSQTPQGSWTQGAQSYASPMEAAQNMGIMDQLRAYNMFTRGSAQPPQRGEPGRGPADKGRSTTPRQNIVNKLRGRSEKVAKKSGWSPYTGESRFANWTPIMKALMNG